jgi:hypothetical protein
MPEDRPRLEAADRAADEMQVRAADRARRDADQRVGGFLYLRIAHGLEPDIADSMENDGFHGFLLENPAVASAVPRHSGMAIEGDRQPAGAPA